MLPRALRSLAPFPKGAESAKRDPGLGKKCKCITRSHVGSQGAFLKEIIVKVGVLGSGGVAKVLAGGFLKHGHDTTVGTRDGAKLAAWIGQNPRAKAGSFAQAAAFGEIIVLAGKGTAPAQVLR